MHDEKGEKLKLLELVRSVVQYDKDLREKLGTADKFRFVRDQLQTLLDQIEKHAALLAAAEEKKTSQQGVGSDETTVYVYLYNAQGLSVPTWQNMLIPKLFYEYSVNRPIYMEEAHIEALVRSKASKAQHGYLAVVIKQKAILTTEETRKLDTLGNPIIKVKEGSLDVSRLLGFYHNEIVYILNEDGRIIKKPE